MGVGSLAVSGIRFFRPHELEHEFIGWRLAAIDVLIPQIVRVTQKLTLLQLAKASLLQLFTQEALLDAMQGARHTVALPRSR